MVPSRPITGEVSGQEHSKPVWYSQDRDPSGFSTITVPWEFMITTLPSGRMPGVTLTL